MAECNSTTILNTMFYEADVAYIGSKSKEPGHQGYGTQQQPFFIALSTLQDNKYPQSIKLKVIPKDDSFTTTLANIFSFHAFCIIALSFCVHH